MTDRDCSYDQDGPQNVLCPSTHLADVVPRFMQTHIIPPFRTVWELVKSAGRIFYDSWNQYAFRSFLGPAVLTSDAYFVMDSYENVRLRSSFRNMARFDPTGPTDTSGNSEIIHGTFSPQAAAVLTALFLLNTGKVLRIATDTEMGPKMNATLICYGTSDSNFKTFDIEVSSESDLCQFSFDGNGQRAFQVAGQHYTLENRGGITYDKAIFMRLASRHNPHHCHIICAGLSEWGSLAAVYYFAKKWKTLHKRFDSFGQRRDFCILLEVPCGQFENPREIASAVRLAPRSRSPKHNRSVVRER